MPTATNVLPGVPDVESPFFERIFQSKNVPPETVEIARKLNEDGFAVIDFPDPDFNQLSAKIINTLNPQYDWDGWRSGKVPNLRIQDAWKQMPEVGRIAGNRQILKLLSDLYGRRAFPFQTLNFAVGTQQHFHSDSIHFSSCPERFMVGVWVALEDIDEENGPLVYYPGSHKLPIFTSEHIGVNPHRRAGEPYAHYGCYIKAWEELVDVLGLKPLYFHARKGQALIWAANLLHGGAAQKNNRRSRYSQVTHYYFDDCAYYTPLGSVPFLGAIEFRDIVDIATGRRVPNVINGVKVTKQSRISSWFKKRSVEENATEPLPSLPSDFDAAAYLRANPDVAAAGVDAARHWLEFGRHEGRPLR